MFRRRLGQDPHANGLISRRTVGCPDLWELEDGTFAVIGEDKTDTLRASLPESAGCGPEERIVVIPRRLLTRAKHDIPEH